MLQDIWTVIRKEMLEIFHMRGTRRAGWLNLLLVVGLMGVYMPLMSGREWVTNAVGPISFAWLPLFLVIGVVADGFAGERERHTLETLLASRLPDRAILFGKIGAAVLYSMGISISSLLVGGVVANLGSLNQGFVFYPLSMLGGLVVFMLFLGILVASIGLLVSLRAATVRQASQTLSMLMLVFWVVIFLGVRFLPESTKQSISAYLQNVNLGLLAAGALAVVVVIDAVLMFVAMARFQRSRLILD
ncbi:MAG TPA: ABC transporter permease subunit [Anaerolinea sp.]|nr:ABC transporter permease subunit [Anaerolinea sp.]